jgi:hypothetical protein
MRGTRRGLLWSKIWVERSLTSRLSSLDAHPLLIMLNFWNGGSVETAERRRWWTAILVWPVGAVICHITPKRGGVASLNLLCYLLGGGLVYIGGKAIWDLHKLSEYRRLRRLYDKSHGPNELPPTPPAWYEQGRDNSAS